MAREATRGGQLGVGALDGEAVSEPVDIPGGVVVDVGEAEGFEPARGAWAQVSETVPAVHDDVAAEIELLRGFAVQLLER